MSSKDTLRVLQAIAYNIDLARKFVGDVSSEHFKDDERTLYAVTRCLEIVSEASRRLPDDVKARHPDVPWSRMAGAGKVYRHDYEDVLASILWNTVRHHLHSLDDAVRKEIENMEGKNI